MQHPDHRDGRFCNRPCDRCDRQMDRRAASNDDRRFKSTRRLMSTAPGR